MVVERSEQEKVVIVSDCYVWNFAADFRPGRHEFFFSLSLLCGVHFGDFDISL